MKGLVKANGFKYSDIYKREIRGNDCCGFWRSKHGGVCVGWPHYKEHICIANEDGGGCPLFPTDGEIEDTKTLAGFKRYKKWADNEISNLERKLYGRTEIEIARADIYRQLTKYLVHFGLDVSRFARFTEELDGACYSATYVSLNGKQSILVSCNDVADPTTEIQIILFK